MQYGNLCQMTEITKLPEIRCPGRYILDVDGNPIPCDDLITWGKWLENPNNRQVKKDFVGKYWVSTVFLSLDHNFLEGEPILWETMIFSESEDETKYDGYQERYSTRQEAIEGHQRAIEMIEKDGKNG